MKSELLQWLFAGGGLAALIHVGVQTCKEVRLLRGHVLDNKSVLQELARGKGRCARCGYVSEVRDDL